MGDSGSDDRPGLGGVNRIVRDPHLSSDQKVLWAIYRSYEGPNGKGAYPGDDLVAEHMDCSPRTVRRHRAVLLERGYLRQRRRGSKAARYWTLAPEVEGEAPEAPDPEDEPDPTGEETPEAPWPPPSKLPKDESGQYVYPPAFERCWELYPDREGGNPKKGAYGAWRARVTDGAEPEELEEATRRYARFVRETDTEPRYVKMAQTFYGPKDFWREDWSVNGDGPPPDDPISSREDALAGLYGEGDDGD